MDIPTKWLKAVYQRIRYCGESALICCGPEGAFIGGTSDFDSVTYYTPRMVSSSPFACRVPFSALEMGFRQLRFPTDSWTAFHKFMKPFYYANGFSNIVYNQLLGYWHCTDYVQLPVQEFLLAMRKCYEVARSGLYEDGIDYSQVGLRLRDHRLSLVAHNGYQHYHWQIQLEQNVQGFGLMGASQAKLLCRWLDRLCSRNAQAQIGLLIRPKGLIIKTAERLLRIRFSNHPFQWLVPAHHFLIATLYFPGWIFNQTCETSLLYLRVTDDEAYLAEWHKNRQRRRYFAEDAAKFISEDLELLFPLNCLLPFMPLEEDQLVQLQILQDELCHLRLTAGRERFSVTLPLRLRVGLDSN